MSKRFTDTEIWKKTWFFELTAPEKLAWYYVLSQCDSVGVWTPNYRLAEFSIGTQLDWEKFAEKCHENIEIFNSGKWFIVDFCMFQYGKLKETCIPHRSFIALLKKHGLFDRVSIGYGYSIDRDKEKEEEEEKELELEKVKEKEQEKDSKADMVKEFARLKRTYAPNLAGHK